MNKVVYPQDDAYSFNVGRAQPTLFNDFCSLFCLLKNRLDCFASARNDPSRHPEGTRAEDVRRELYPFNASVKSPKYLSTKYKNEPSPEFVSSPQLTNKFYPLTKREGKDKNGKRLINLSTYRLIDFKTVTNLFPSPLKRSRQIELSICRLL